MCLVYTVNIMKNTTLTSVNNGTVTTVVPNVKLVHTLPKIDKEKTFDAIKKINECEYNAKLYRALLIASLIKWYGNDVKNEIKERFTDLSNDYINACALVADKFIDYEFEYALDEKNKDSNGNALMVVKADTLDNIANCKGKISGLKDASGYALSWTAMYELRNLDDDIRDKLINEKKITYKTTMAEIRELLKPYRKNTKSSTKTSGNGTGNGTGNATKSAIDYDKIKTDLDRFNYITSLLNRMSDAVKGHEKYSIIAENVLFFMRDLSDDTENNESNENNENNENNEIKF